MTDSDDAWLAYRQTQGEQGMNNNMGFATKQRPRLDLLEPRNREHVWTAFAVYRVSAETLSAAHGGQLHLDKENLATIEVGCFVCEKAYSEHERHRKCTGEPR